MSTLKSSQASMRLAPRHRLLRVLLVPVLAALLPTTVTVTLAQPPTLELNNPRRSALNDLLFDLHAPAGILVTLERATRLDTWSPVRTLRTSGNNTLTNFVRSDASAAYFRAREINDPDALTGDHLTTDAGDVVIHPVNHASFVLGWQNRMIYVDPVGGAAPYQDLPRADLILVTHSHGDHFHAATLDAVAAETASLITPAAVYNSLPANLRSLAIPLANDESTNLLGVSVLAVPAYNDRHPRGAGNGYVLEIGGRRIYASGDTGAIPETRALENIDVAFLCMNVPFTMTVAEAASVVRDFRPRVLYPYHYRNQDQSFANLASLRQQVGAEANVEIRLRPWY